MNKIIDAIKTNKTLKNNLITIGMVVLLYVFCQIFSVTGIMSHSMRGLLVQFCYYIILAVSLNLTVGILGELSLGHAGFMCVGAFTSAIMCKTLGTSITSEPLLFVLCVIGGAITAAVAGFLIGIPVLKLKGDYLAIVTLAFGEIIKNIFGSLYVGVDSKGVHISLMDQASLGLEESGKMIVNGPLGVTNLSSTAATFTGCTILVVLTLVIVLNFVNSRTGRAVMAIRDNRIAAEATGINITKYKMLAFTISASLAGVGGVIYANSLSTLTSNSKNFGYNMSIMILVYVVLGGIGSIRGSVIATVILVLLPEKLRFLSNYRMLFYAVLLIAMMLFNWAPKSREWRDKMVAKYKKKIGKSKGGKNNGNK